MSPLEQYKDRAKKQKELCDKGTHVHSVANGECCPCFGCCIPELADKKHKDVEYEN